MSANRYDISLDGISLRIDRSKGGGYTRGWQRAEHGADSYAIPVTSRPIYASRPDYQVMHQTSWSGGAAWWKPMLSEDSRDLYNLATNMDCFSTPGLIIPANLGTVSATDLAVNGHIFRVGANVYAIGTTKTVDSTNWDIYKWTAASSDWVVVAGVTCGQANEIILSCVYDPTDSYIYVMSTTYVSRFKLAGTVGANWLALSPNADAGDGLRVQNGRLLMRIDGKIQEITKSGPTYASISDDGMGKDLLYHLGLTATNRIARSSDLCLFDASADGIYWVKNTQEGGIPRCWLFKVERDSNGADIATPLAALPLGSIGLNVACHLGSVVVTATPDAYLMLANDRSKGFPRIDVYHYSSGNLGLIGSFDRTSTGPSQSPLRIMGADGAYLYFGSHLGVWVYDARQGGVHTYLTPTALASGVWRDVAYAERPTAGQCFIIYGNGKTVRYATTRADPKLVTNFGDDLTTYTLVSNYFDFQLPLEDKTLASVIIQSELLTTNQKWYVYISVDDGTWTLVASHTGAVRITETSLSTSGYTGKRFRYKLVFETKTAAVPGIMALQFNAYSGLMLAMWELRFDAGSATNAEGRPIRPDEVYDSFEVSAIKKTPVTLIDYFQSHDASISSTSTVVIRSVQIVKSDPAEAIITVSLLGA